MYLTLLLSSVLGQSCTVADDLKSDCGYVGINQQLCQNKGCCWQPSNQPGKNIPWCFYKGGDSPCENITFKHSGGPGFTNAFYDQMYKLFDSNINIQSKGGVVAAPDNSTPGGSYYYHWMRDAGLTMRLYQELNDFDLSKVDDKMKKYTEFVQRTNDQNDPYGNDVRINPKFELPNGEVYVGGWCRPQTDGPALTATALIIYGNTLLDKGQSAFVNSDLWTNGNSKKGGAIYNNLDWVVRNWKQQGCDLWEEVRSNDFFWNRMAFRHALELGQKFATRVGNNSMASTYKQTRAQIQDTLAAHWTGSYMKESNNRERDGAVTHALSSFPGYLAFTDSKIAATIKNYNLMFCSIYQLNQKDNQAGIPGVLYGRYQGDTYAGGNPWQLLTAVLAKLFYQGAQEQMQLGASGEFLSEDVVGQWRDLFKLGQRVRRDEFVTAALEAGDAVMFRLYQHVKDDGGHIAEQIDKNSGKQTSAKDLTWSYGNVLDAYKFRGTVKQQLSAWLNAAQ